MGVKISNLKSFLRKVYFLARPYGRAKLGFVFLVILAQGIFQVIGVTSIFPFLALASNPSIIRESTIGMKLTRLFPEWTDNQWLILAGIFAIFMLCASNALMLLGEVVRARYSHGFGHWLRLRLLNRMVSNPYSYFLKHNTGILLKKTTGDVMAYINGVLARLLEAIARVITVSLLLATLILVDPLLAFGAGIGFALFYIIIFAIMKNRRKTTSDQMKIAFRGAMKEAQQLLGGIKPVKVHCKEAYFAECYSRHSFTQAVLSKWMPVYQNFPRYVAEPLAFGGVVAIVVVLAARGEDFLSLLPTLGVMALAGYRLLPNFQLLYGAATGMSLMMHSLEEVYEEFIEAEDSASTESTAGTEKLAPYEWNRNVILQEVSFKYQDGSTPVLDRLSLEIPKNTFVAFIGETGSGKSTLVDLILGLHWPQEGQILIDGSPLTRDLVRRWRMGIGYVPQEIFLLDDSITANIAFGIFPGKVDMEQVRKVARVAQIADFIEKELPEGYDTQVGERGVRLSGGQRQRIGLARALYHKPGLLVLDEATSALDNETEALLMKAIESLYGKLTMVAIAHRLTTVKNADCIFKLNHGKIEKSGVFSDICN